MLQKYLDRLLFEAQDPTIFQLAPSVEDREAWNSVPGPERAMRIREADKQLRLPIPALTATSYMRFQQKGDASAYREPCQARRKMLSAVVMGLALRADDSMDERLIDLIWAISEESSWVLPENSPLAMGENSLPLPELREPLIDRNAADTAMELCMTAQIAGERLYNIAPQLLGRIADELDRRIITPFLEARDFEWMCGPKWDAMACLRGVMISFLSFEPDGKRRWLCLRKAWILLDRLLSQLPQDGSISGGVSEWLNVAGPVMDCLYMIHAATNGVIDLRHEMQIQLMCHYPVLCHIAQGWFVNPGAQSMKPVLSGPAMYRIGMQVHDRALCDLGAYLFKTQGEGPEETLLMHASRNAMLRARLENEQGVPPFRRQGYLNAQELMVARMAEDSEKGLALAIHGGNNGQIGGHPDVGDIMLFAHGQPVLVDAGCFDETSLHSLPVIGASQQAGGAVHRAQDVNCRLEEGYAMLSMNLMDAYPPEAHVSTWQRTAIFNREDGTVQLIDVFDLAAFETVRFHFITPIQPVLGERFAQLGPVRLRWEEGLAASSEELKITGEPWTALWGENLYRLTLSTVEPVNGGQYTFNLNALRTFGH